MLKILPKEERELVDLITAAINDGNHSQKSIVEFVKEKTTLGDKKIRERLIANSIGENPAFTVASTGRGKDLHYSLFDSLLDFEALTKNQ